MTRLGTAEGKERHWLYVCPKCGTWDMERTTCDGYDDETEHDPVETEMVRIVGAVEYDELDVKLAHAERALKAADDLAKVAREAWPCTATSHQPRLDGALRRFAAERKTP